jgi:hypothetical protein
VKSDLPVLLTVPETASLLRTTVKAVYAMVERRQLAGVVRLGRRVLFRSEVLLNSLDQSRASSKDRSPKTVNNVLTVLSVLLKKAVEWEVVDKLPCAVRLLSIPKSTAARFDDFEEFARVVEAAKQDGQATFLIARLVGKRAFVVARSWRSNGQTSTSRSVRSQWLGRSGKAT